jgi:imidazoleglycerol-phosphate dehydratase
MSVVERRTSETRIRLEINQGDGRASVSTGLRFLDHMMVTLARYSRLDLSIQASGDL